MSKNNEIPLIISKPKARTNKGIIKRKGEGKENKLLNTEKNDSLKLSVREFHIASLAST